MAYIPRRHRLVSDILVRKWEKRLQYKVETLHLISNMLLIDSYSVKLYVKLLTKKFLITKFFVWMYVVYLQIRLMYCFIHYVNVMSQYIILSWRITHYCVIEDLNMLNISQGISRDISSRFPSNSEANASELLGNLENNGLWIMNKWLYGICHKYSLKG